jgi:hypothetical protein
MSSLRGCGCRPGRLCDEHRQERRRTILDRLTERTDCTGTTITITILRLNTKPRKQTRLDPQRLAAGWQCMKRHDTGRRMLADYAGELGPAESLDIAIGLAQKTIQQSGMSGGRREEINAVINVIADEIKSNLIDGGCPQ